MKFILFGFAAAGIITSAIVYGRRRKRQAAYISRNERFYYYITGFIGRDKRMPVIGMMSQLIMQQREQTPSIVVEEFHYMVNSLSEDLVLDYYNETGDVLFDHLSDSIEFYGLRLLNKENRLRYTALLNIETILKGSSIGKDLQKWNQNINYEQL